MLLTIVVAGSAAPAWAQPGTLIPGVRAEMHPRSFFVPAGQPVWVRFALENTSDEPITLTVPGSKPEIPSPESGLPLSHVFGVGSSADVSVTGTSGHRWDVPIGYRLATNAPILMIAPHGTVGVTVDLRTYFPAFRGAGQYRVTWEPYEGAVGSGSVVLTIAPLKQAQIVTDAGNLTVHLHYADAPRHVQNFIELAESGFYDGKVFHRLEPGYFIQGGCPRGDGTGIRPDGKRVPAEFNAHPMLKGSVAMALLNDDPDSGSSQFFICNTRQKEWDGRYTVFGDLVGDNSFDVLDKLMSTPVDGSGRAFEPPVIRDVRITDAPPDTLP